MSRTSKHGVFVVLGFYALLLGLWLGPKVIAWLKGLHFRYAANAAQFKQAVLT